MKALSMRRAGGWKALELFEREARVLQGLSHAGIPRYIDYLTQDSATDRSFFLVQARKAPAITWTAPAQACQIWHRCGNQQSPCMG